MTIEYQNISGNRIYKDALFRMVFHRKVYSSTLQKIPTPQFFVFYNGTKELPDRQIEKLFDAFMTENGCLEYAIFVDTVRKYAAIKYGIDQARIIEDISKNYSLSLDEVSKLYAAYVNEAD